MNYFQDDLPAFISIQGDRFLIDTNPYPHLRVMIQRIQPVRKYFRDGSLMCYSMDTRISNTGTYCVFCTHRYKCQRKLRLHMLHIETSPYQPVILEINQPSFPSLETFINKIGGDEYLHATPVSIKLAYDERDIRTVEFIE